MANNSNTQQDILHKIEDLFLRYGIKSVTMDDISRHLGISKKTLYQYVDNKADLINKVLRQHIESEKREVINIQKRAKNAIHEMLAIARYVISMLRRLNPSTMYDLQKYYSKSWEIMHALHKEYMYETIIKNLYNGQSEGLYRGDFNPEIIARFYIAKVESIVSEDIFPSNLFTKEKVYQAFIQYHIHGIATEKGIKLFEKHFKETIK